VWGLHADFRFLGSLTIEQQAKLDKLRKDVTEAGYIDRTDDSTLVYSLFRYLCVGWSC